VVLEGLEEFADFGAGGVVEFGEGFGDVADLTRDDGPAVFLEPGRDGVDGGALGDETGAAVVLGDIVVLEVRELFEIVRAGLDGGGFEVAGGVGVVGLDEADVFEEELVAAGVAEDALLEENAHLGRGALVVVGVDFDDERDFVRGVAFEDDVFERGFVATGAGALGDGAFDDVAGDAGFFGFFDRGEEPGVAAKIAATELGGDGDFLGQFAGDLGFAFVNNRAFCVEPLTSHKVNSVANGAAASNAESIATDSGWTSGVSGKPWERMKKLGHLFEQNKVWADSIRQKDPEFFQKLSRQQSPEYLWIGCSDSRVPANEIIGLLPGEVFVHRNVANVVVHADLNALSVIQYAVDVLKVKHIMVVGHYGCGGVQATMRCQRVGLVDNWLRHVQDVKSKHIGCLCALPNEAAQVARLCELNVIEQAVNVCATTIVQDAWARGQALTVHGWIYGLTDGRLQDLKMTVSGPDEVDPAYAAAVAALQG